MCATGWQPISSMMSKRCGCVTIPNISMSTAVSTYLSGSEEKEIVDVHNTITSTGMPTVSAKSIISARRFYFGISISKKIQYRV